MTARGAFSILEVLLATVLLAVVVTVCTPYLRLRAVPAPETSRDLLSTRVREELAERQLTNRAKIDYRDYAEIAQLNGWVCEPIHQFSHWGGDLGVGGAWVRLSDGHTSSVHWVATEIGGAE